jgi:AAA ATPase domain
VKRGVKGLSDPLRVFELEGAAQARTRLEVSRARGFTKFVGRHDEMAALEAAFARAIGGSAQVVGVVGEPGLGKSRLCFEFLERCRARGLSIFEGHGFPHGRALALLPMLELFRSFFGITEQDADQVAREKIAGRFLLLDESLREVLPLLFDLLSVGRGGALSRPSRSLARAPSRTSSGESTRRRLSRRRWPGRSAGRRRRRETGGREEPASSLHAPVESIGRRSDSIVGTSSETVG